MRSGDPARIGLTTVLLLGLAWSGDARAGGPLLQIEVVSAEGVRRPLSPGGAARGGERLSLAVTVDQPGHVYVVQVFGGGGASVLYPRAGEAAPVLQPGQPLRLPPPGEVLQLDDELGDEDLCVLTTQKPLLPGDLKGLRDLCRPRPAADAPPPPPPPFPTKGNERLPPKERRTTSVTQVRTSKGALTVLRFPFQHEVRRKQGK